MEIPFWKWIVFQKYRYLEGHAIDIEQAGKWRRKVSV